VGGLLYLHYCGEHEFTHNEIVTLGFCAEQTALAISNSRRQDELIHTNRVVWMSLNMSNIRHEIRQKSETIQMTLHSLSHSLKDSKELERLKRININIDAITKLQDQALPSSANIRPVAVGLFMLRELRRWTKSVHVVDDHVNLSEWWANVDSTQFALVLKNLATNAVRAMEGRPIKILTVKGEIIGARIVVQISNTGSQIRPELQKKLCADVIEAQDGNRHRTGIGLFIGRRIMRFHGGDLSLISSNEANTTFSFWLPGVKARTLEEAREILSDGKI